MKTSIKKASQKQTLHIENLNYSISKKQILKNLNVTLKSGSFTALIGPNGSGKSTLLKCLTGIYDIPTQTIFIDDIPLENYTPKTLAQIIAYLPQERSFLFDIKVFDLVMMGRYPYQKALELSDSNDYDLVVWALRKTDTFHLQNRMVKTLSGGEFQRVVIAQALAQQTPILLLDEPLSNLDLRHQKETMELLKEIHCSENKTILIVAHDLNLVSKYCPETLLLKQGEIVFKGATENALNPQQIKDVFEIDVEYLKYHNRFLIVF